VTAVRVVVVEDSPVQRAHLVDVLEAERDIAVIGQAGDPVEATALVRRLHPDVVTMDLGLPGDGGLGAIERIMADLPTPILVLSARVTGAGSAAAVESLLAGAVEALPKPERWDAEAGRQLRCRVRLLRWVTVVAHPRGRRRLAAPVLVVQHLHPQLVDGFVSWMRRVSALPVVVAADGDRPQPGVVYIAPAGAHLKLVPVLAAVPAGPTRAVPAGGGRLVLDPDQPVVWFQLGVALGAVWDRRGARRAYSAALAALERCDPGAVEAGMDGWVADELAGVLRARLGRP
jgi:chemotaxis response regulator CheB